MTKVAVVTGGAGGIGQAVADRLIKDNCAVVILDINEEAGQKVVADLRARGAGLLFQRADLTLEPEVQSAFEKITAAHGRVDVLVNVAGGSMHRHRLEEFPLKNWQTVIDANLTSTFLCCRAVVGMMKQQKSGAIVNISSDIAFSGSENRSAYAAAKAGILGLTKTLALELAAFGVRVNAVAPGRIDTPRVRASYTDADWLAAAKGIPLGHAGLPEDVSEAVAYLASDAAKHMTGQTIHVNGGRIMT
ncbi:MAG TPA: SDR family NAD(P)-dependent oxidoreductase [Candidatus Binatia bacterium]|nr:SDR family NAD(P)-dependent oxidoreductase [Candidatus Binatia bacterium]